MCFPITKQIKLFSAFLTAAVLVFGTTGCRSNGSGGAWYSPKSYTLYNPFKKAEADLYNSEKTSQTGTNSKPSLDSHPDVSVPPGGYAHPGKESEFFANGNQKQGQKAVQTQYGYNVGGESVMTAANPYSVPEAANNPYSAAPYSAAPSGMESYNPYTAAPYGTTEPATPSGFQQTRYYEPQNTAVPAAHPAIQQYPQPNPIVPNGADISPVYGNQAAVPSNVPAVQPQIPYSPAYPAAPYSNAPATYGTAAATPAETAAPQGIIGQGIGTAPAGYTANPSSYQPVGGGF